jgi:hypothetical protein
MQHLSAARASGVHYPGHAWRRRQLSMERIRFTKVAGWNITAQ